MSSSPIPRTASILIICILNEGDRQLEALDVCGNSRQVFDYTDLVTSVAETSRLITNRISMVNSLSCIVLLFGVRSLAVVGLPLFRIKPKSFDPTQAPRVPCNQDAMVQEYRIRHESKFLHDAFAPQVVCEAIRNHMANTILREESIE
jgi:hypothetical protein